MEPFPTPCAVPRHPEKRFDGDDGSIDAVVRLPLGATSDQMFGECRTVLPGIQGLFGFQLIAVFSERFAALSQGEQTLHLAATFLVAIAVALVMTPAAYHRQTAGPEQVTRHFVRLCSRLLLWSMLPLACGICLDFYLIALLVTGGDAAAALIAGSLLIVFAGLWIALPAWQRRIHGQVPPP